MKKSRARLQTERLYEAARKAEDALPRMVDRLVERFEDGRLSAKEMAIIFRAVSSMARANDRLDDDLGLKKQQPGQTGNPLVAILGDVNIKLLSPDELDRRIIDALRGKTAVNVGTSVQVPTLAARPVEAVVVERS